MFSGKQRLAIALPAIVATAAIGCGVHDDPAPSNEQPATQPPDPPPVKAEPALPQEADSASAREIIPEPAPAADDEPVIDDRPAIDDGPWIGPINGLRFAIRPVGTTFHLDGPIPLLLLVQNTTDHKITWPGFRPETSVRRNNVPNWKPAYDPDANLRVWVEPVQSSPFENDTPRRIQIEGYGNYVSPPKSIGPGQTSIYLFNIQPYNRKRVWQHHPKDSNHASMGIIWYDNQYRGDYTIKIRYEGWGFEPPEDQYRGATLEGWQDVWIDFHHVTVTLR